MNPLHLLRRQFRRHQFDRHLPRAYAADPEGAFRTPADAVTAAQSLIPFAVDPDREIALPAAFWIGHLYAIALHRLPGNSLARSTRPWFDNAAAHLLLVTDYAASPLLRRRAHFLLAVLFDTYATHATALPHYQRYLDLREASPLDSGSSEEQIYEEAYSTVVARKAVLRRPATA